MYAERGGGARSKTGWRTRGIANGGSGVEGSGGEAGVVSGAVEGGRRVRR